MTVHNRHIFNLTINIDRKIRRRVPDNLPGLFNDAGHPDLVDLMGFDDSESDALVDFIVFRALRREMVSIFLMHWS